MKIVNFLMIGLLIAGTSSLSSCKKKKEPIAIFNYTGGECTAPCAVLFENKSENATNYAWDFGDGTVSSDVNPTKTYNTGGTYNVTLTATGNGKSSSISKTILIQQSAQSQQPTANFSFSGGGCVASCSVNFTNTSSNASSYLWDFGDGTTSTVQNPSHNYSSGGTFTVTLKATNDAGSNQISKNVNIMSAPTKVKITKLTITGMPFVDGSGSSWDYSNGPDVYFNITDQAGNIFLNGESSKINDVTSSTIPISWDFTTPYEITSFTTPRFIDVWDYDTPDSDDYIGYVGFQMNNYTSGSNAYPTSITKSQNGITIRLELVWQ